tara:strand:+ start:112 stop:255 length:144 start_codon:yes stop_codon:yes gene_type:complete
MDTDRLLIARHLNSHRLLKAPDMVMLDLEAAASVSEAAVRPTHSCSC